MSPNHLQCIKLALLIMILSIISPANYSKDLRSQTLDEKEIIYCELYRITISVPDKITNEQCEYLSVGKTFNSSVDDIVMKLTKQLKDVSIVSNTPLFFTPKETEAKCNLTSKRGTIDLKFEAKLVKGQSLSLKIYKSDGDTYQKTGDYNMHRGECALVEKTADLDDDNKCCLFYMSFKDLISSEEGAKLAKKDAQPRENYLLTSKVMVIDYPIDEIIYSSSEMSLLAEIGTAATMRKGAPQGYALQLQFQKAKEKGLLELSFLFDFQMLKQEIRINEEFNAKINALNSFSIIYNINNKPYIILIVIECRLRN